MDDDHSEHNNMMKKTMHMTFFWGQNTEILFQNWPGYSNTGMYFLALLSVAALALLVEFLSHSSLIRRDSTNLVSGFLQTVMHGVRMCLAYLVMLAIMSFNVGVFLAAIFGHVVGFFLFGSRVFGKSQNPVPYGKPNDLPPMTC